MPDKPIELWIDLPPEIKRAIERAAAARGLSVSEFVRTALRKFLFDAGYIDDEAAD
jgi:uncharacterized protein (DUF1778 family)